ncbi:MAG TPA: hypothetical protein VF150_13715 [Thermoanaerobaculia bacterium]
MRRLAAFASILSGALAASLFVLPDEAGAIPAFARRYQFSCTTCHAPFPRLKPYGEEFAARGFRLEDPSQEPSRAEYDVGDPLLRLVRDLPLAMRLEGYGSWTEDAQAEGDFETPWVWKILSGGPLSDKVSYYLYFILEKNETENLEDAYLQVNDLFGSGVDLLFGQFQVSDPLFKRELRLERTDYLIYRTRVGASSVDLTYDRGILLGTTLPGEVDASLQVVNGNGIPSGEFDNDDHKDVALRLSRSWGAVRVGAFGYLGKEEDEAGVENETTYWGPDVTLAAGERWELNLQYLRREDDDPFFVTRRLEELSTDGGFAELHFFPAGQDGRWAVSGLYNRVESDERSLDAEDLAIALNYLLARNVRVLTEAGRDLEADRSRVSVGLVAAF